MIRLVTIDIFYVIFSDVRKNAFFCFQMKNLLWSVHIYLKFIFLLYFFLMIEMRKNKLHKKEIKKQSTFKNGLFFYWNNII
ncbi:hypothetical protein COJ07_03030 [Bacillus cereus]|nr:hypothetical protein COJ07_03030 [Bacillus cereus]